MGEFVSKGAALGTSIPALVLGSLGFLQSGGLNGGGLGGILGGGAGQAAMMANAVGQQALAEKDSIIARLQSEKYADHVGIDVYKQSRVDNTDLQDRILGNWVKPLAQESAANRERLATLEAQFKCEGEKTQLREALIEQKFQTANSEMLRHVDDVADKSACGIAANAQGIAALRSVIDSITVTHVPATSICPEPMPRWNSFTVPEGAAPAIQPVKGSVNA